LVQLCFSTSPMLDNLKHLFSKEAREAGLKKRLDKLRAEVPVPVFWLIGKTQSGKTSIIKYLTGAEDAEIGQGFKPCTRFSRQYQFPTADAPLLTFLDTRGMDEPGYDPKEDLAKFDAMAHVVILTVKVLDHALENFLKHWKTMRRSRPDRPAVLALTCLHEAYPQEQHLLPYPFAGEPQTWTTIVGMDGQDDKVAKRQGDPETASAALGSIGPPISVALVRSLAAQRDRFKGLVDHVVPVDLTPPGEGFNDPNYGGEKLKETLLNALPGGYRQTLIMLDKATRELQDFYAAHALPYILGYSSLAATAGAFPIPWVDLLVLPSIQTRMIYRLAEFYGQPLSGQRFLELASTMGLGLVMRQAVREVVKFIPVVGSLAGATLAGTSTFALGKAFCYYYRAVHKGHVPKPEDLRHYYQEQLAVAEQEWRTKGK
ncbi:MAG TPA: DUF697 domain-containing protein, partial [Gemmataceae bacterium]|nr:DUF697 domain-containing protein [Gemmataceae bacterium]